MSEKLSLKEIRESKGITKAHIYNLLGISRQSFHNKENGKAKFTALEVQKLCSEYNVPISEVKL